MANHGATVREVAQVGLAISDPNRLRLLMALDGRSLCVCQLTELLGLAPSTVSKHLSILKQTGMVNERKEGRWVFHELCGGDCVCTPALDWVKGCLGEDARIVADKAKLKEILAQNREELCRGQTRRK